MPLTLLADQTALAQLVPVGDLIPHEENPNHGDVAAIAQSIRASGFWGVIVAQLSSRRILVGEHRWRAAQEAGLTEVPVQFVDVDDTRARILLLADNKYAELAERDPIALKALLDQLAAGPGLEGTGYSQADYAELLAEVSGEVENALLTDEDDAPEVQPLRLVTRPGDLWQIGPHRVRCGDSLNETHLRDLLGGERADLIWTDPPYNVAYEGKTKDRLTIDNDAMTPEEFALFISQAMRSAVANIRDGACVYVAYAEVETVAFRLAFDGAGLKYSQTLVWVKNAAVLSRQDYNWRHEPMLYGWKLGAGHYFSEDYTQTTVWDASADLSKLSKAELLDLLEQTRAASGVMYVDKPNRNDIHPTMKPVELVRRALVASSKPGWKVLDPFGGSGTTLIAAHKAGRVAYLNELAPKYVDAIVRRAQDALGVQAVRHDGVNFNDAEVYDAPI